MPAAPSTAPPQPIPAAVESRYTAPRAYFSSKLNVLIASAIVVTGLYFGREILVPIALSLLLSFVLAPGVRLLIRWHVGRITSVLVMVAFTFTAILAVGAVVGTQIGTLAENLPRYESTVTGKIHSLQNALGQISILERASRMLRNISDEVSKPEVKEPSTTILGVPTAESDEPVTVRVEQPPLRPFEIILDVIGPVLSQMATIGLVIVFVIFILLQREDLRDRLVRLAGVRDLQRTTQALTDAAERVSRYLLMQTVVNATYALPIGIGLWVIGVPNPILWAILAFVLRFVPYIGPIIAATFPLLLSVAVDPGWSMLAWTAALFVTIEIISNNFIEPRLYGGSTGLSSLAIILAATFWTWLWGPIGLLLSTPLTSSLVVLGRHVPGLQFLEVALSDQPALAPEEGLYQRLLAGDPVEAAMQAEAYLKLQPLSGFYDEVMIRALALAQEDVRRGALDGEQQGLIRAAAEEVIEDLSDYDDVMPEAEKSLSDVILPKSPRPGEKQAEPVAASSIAPRFEPSALPPAWQGKPVLCVASRTDLDAVAAYMLAQLLGKHGIGARVIPWAATTAGNLSLLDEAGVELLFISCLDPRLSTHVRYLVRRLRRKFPKAKIVVGFWTQTTDTIRQEIIDGTGVELLVSSLGEALELAGKMIRETASPGVVRALAPVR
ncbi:MAG TPA: AI-2E family transporter [Verrucomicrobiae bacterium]|nr:AI-2E family transporter [Verrucomicrobiae bacterium]